MGISCRDFVSSTVVSLLLFCLCKEAASRLVSNQHLQYVRAAPINAKLRPAYHFQPPKNWMNDPNGPMLYKGVYHFFYQYNPYPFSAAVKKEWGHSISTDLINWIPLESAIFPSEPFDKYGCWSGSATFLQGNKPAILYTGLIDRQKHQVQNIAYPKNLSDPYLREWVKPNYNPVMPPAEGINASSFRDPTTAWLGPDNQWRIVVGSKWGSEGKAILYKSSDFDKWIRVENPLYSVNGSGMWECPDFYPVSTERKYGLDTSDYSKDTKQVLKVSLDLLKYDWYTIGVYNDSTDTYIPDGTGMRYDYGNFYASKSFYDPVKRRRIVWGWSNESDSTNVDKAKGWSGIQSIPRTVWLDPSGKQLLQWPVEELNSLRGNQVSVTNKTIKGGDHLELDGIQTAQADVEVMFDVLGLDKAEPFDPKYANDAQAYCKIKGADMKGGVGPFGLHVLATSDLQEKTTVFFRVFKSENKHVVLMCNDPSKSSLAPDLYKPTFASFVEINLANTSKISLRTLIDHSVVESFGSGGTACITSRVYPTLGVGDDAHLFLFNNGAVDIMVSQLDAWEIKTPLIN